jgi:hypothetical protein
MIQRLGISLYPQKQSLDAMKKTLHVAADAGFSRLFVAFLGLEPKRVALEAMFGEILAEAKRLNFDVTADVHPAILKALGGSKGSFGLDLSVFKALGVDTLRLDLGLSEFEEVLLSKNPHGIRLELNMSFESAHVASLLQLGADPDRIWGCHNYYPQRYTGLGLDFFNDATQLWSDLHLNTAAFISTQRGERVGPWPITEGLPTLEMHRDLDVTLQYAHYLSLGTINDVLFGDVPSDDELKQLGALSRHHITLPITLAKNVPNSYHELLKRPYTRRPDLSDHLVRTLEGRLFPSDLTHAPFNLKDIEVGDVLMCNQDYGQYAGELQIALKPLKNDGKRSIMGRVRPDAHFLLAGIRAGQAFQLNPK